MKYEHAQYVAGSHPLELLNARAALVHEEWERPRKTLSPLHEATISELSQRPDIAIIVSALR